MFVFKPIFSTKDNSATKLCQRMKEGRKMTAQALCSVPDGMATVPPPLQPDLLSQAFVIQITI